MDISQNNNPSPRFFLLLCAALTGSSLLLSTVGPARAGADGQASETYYECISTILCTQPA